MTFARNRFVAAVSAFAALVAVAAGCSTQPQPSTPPPQTPSTANSPTAAHTSPPTVTSQIDARWTGFDTGRPWNWEETDRRITREFQQFGFRPVGETELPRRCNGCGVAPPTAFVTVYAPGAFDPKDSLTDRPVSVIGDDDGFFRAAEGSENAVLTWQYTENGWATVRGRTTATSDLDRMLELAHVLRPAERTPIRLPMSLAKMPASMPLAEIKIDHGDYGTRLEFAVCGMTDISAVPDCMVDADNLSVQIWPSDGYYGHIQQQRAVPVKAGRKGGLYDELTHQAAVQVQPGMLVEFELSGPSGIPPKPPTSDLQDILANVAWAPDPGNEATWRPVSDWAK